MKNRNIIKTFLILVALTGSFLVLLASSKNAKAGNNSTNACQESMDACCTKEQKGGKMIWEGLSQQFFSSI